MASMTKGRWKARITATDVNPNQVAVTWLG